MADQIQVPYSLEEQLNKIKAQTETLFKKVQTEGITDKSGNVLLPAVNLKDIPALDITPTSVPKITADSFETLKNQAITALASATSQDEFLKAQQELFKQQQLELQGQQTEQKGWLDKAKELITGRQKTADILKTEQERLGIPAMWSNVQTLIPEIGALNTRLAQLQTAEMSEVSNIQQNPQYSVQFASREATRVSREYAIKQAGVSAELGAKTALIQAYQGNIDAARNMVSDIVNAMNYDTNQKLQDYNTFIDNNQNFINNLETSQKDILNDIQRYWETKDKQDRDDLKYKWDRVIDAADKRVNLGLGATDVAKMSKEEIDALYEQKVSSVIAEKGKPESVVDIREKQESLIALIGQVATYPSKEIALADLEMNKTAIILQVGENGYNQIKEEINRIFPEKIPSKPVPPAFPSVAETGKKVRGVFGKAAKWFAEPFTKEVIPTVSSFFQGLFGR